MLCLLISGGGQWHDLVWGNGTFDFVSYLSDSPWLQNLALILDSVLPFHLFSYFLLGYGGSLGKCWEQCSILTWSSPQLYEKPDKFRTNLNWMKNQINSPLTLIGWRTKQIHNYLVDFEQPIVLSTPTALLFSFHYLPPFPPESFSIYHVHVATLFWLFLLLWHCDLSTTWWSVATVGTMLWLMCPLDLLYGFLDSRPCFGMQWNDFSGNQRIGGPAMFSKFGL